jgi:hypothetical protein
VQAACPEGRGTVRKPFVKVKKPLPLRIGTAFAKVVPA